MQAESSCARDWNVYKMPPTPASSRTASRTASSPVARTATRTVYKVNYKRKLYIKSALIVFAYALLLVFLCMKSAALGYQIEKLELDVQNLETANYRLNYQIAEKSSLPRVEQVASAQLGMVKPESKSSVAMEVKTAPVQVAAVPAGNAEATSISQKLLNVMYTSLSRLAQIDK